MGGEFADFIRRVMEYRRKHQDYYGNLDNYLATAPTSGSQSAGGDTTISGSIDPEHPDWYGGELSTPPVISYQPVWDQNWWGTPPANFETGTYRDQFTGGTTPDRTNEALIAELIASLGAPFQNANTSSSANIGGDNGITGMDPKYPGDNFIPTGGKPTGSGRSAYNGPGIDDSWRDIASKGAAASTGDGSRQWSHPIWPGDTYGPYPRGATPRGIAMGGGEDANYLNHLALSLIMAERSRANGGQRITPTTPGPLNIQHSSDAIHMPTFFGGRPNPIPTSQIPARNVAPPPPSRYGSGFPGSSPTPQRSGSLDGIAQAALRNQIRNAVRNIF